MKLNKRYLKILLSTIIILTLAICSNITVYAATSDINIRIDAQNTDRECSVSFQLPKTLGKTNFNVPMSALKELSNEKTNYQFKGVPFLLSNQTYIPTRDIAEAFGISVLYNPQDRAVRLICDEKELIIMPDIVAYGWRASWLKLPSNETDCRGYIIINDMSYVPLRFILEYFTFDVQYSNQQIIISGKLATNPQKSNDFFADSTYDIVTKAFSSYEGSKTVSYKGLKDGENITATLNKVIGLDKIDYQYDINVNGKHYKAAALGGPNGGGVYETDAPIDMTECHFGGHPYAYIAVISNYHFGVSKYSKQEHLLIYEDEKILKYQTEKNNLGIETVEISRENGKLLRITISDTDGTVTKDLEIVY